MPVAQGAGRSAYAAFLPPDPGAVARQPDWPAAGFAPPEEHPAAVCLEHAPGAQVHHGYFPTVKGVVFAAYEIVLPKRCAQVSAGAQRHQARHADFAFGNVAVAVDAVIALVVVGHVRGALVEQHGANPYDRSAGNGAHHSPANVTLVQQASEIVAGYQKSRQQEASVHYNGPYGCTAMKRVITAQDVPAAGELRIPIGALVTPSAREIAEGRGVRIVELPEDQLSALAPPEKTIAMGADHGGYLLKEALKPILEGLGLEVRDVGVYDEKPADYPDLALKVAELVAAGTAARGIVIDGAGIGSSIAANKVPGIRAALCYDKASARNSREHNDSNVLTLGARLLTQTQAEEVLRTWIATPFAGGRHQARVQKILDIERKYLRKDPS